jgi:hypothetical protein
VLDLESKDCGFESRHSDKFVSCKVNLTNINALNLFIIQQPSKFIQIYLKITKNNIFYFVSIFVGRIILILQIDTVHDVAFHD